MPELVAQALIAHRAEFPPTCQGIAHTDGYIVRGAELVFFRTNGKPTNARECGRGFQIARAKAGVSDEATFHILRHTYVSIQIAAGTPLTALRDRLGHGSIQVTADIYGRLLPTEDDRTRAAIDDAFTNDEGGDDDATAAPLAA
jgi:integrase